MKKIKWLSLLLFSMPIWSKQSIDVIAIEYPPFTSNYINGYGINFNLLEKFATYNFKTTFQPLFVPPARAQKLMQTDDWCLSFYPPKPNDKYAKFQPLSEEVVKLGLYRLKNHMPFEWQSLSELKGKSVALLRPSKQGPIHRQLINAQMKLIFVETVEQGLSMLLHGRVDYAFGDNTAIKQTVIGKENKSKLQFSKSTLLEAQVGFFYNTRCEHKLFTQKALDLKEEVSKY